MHASHARTLPCAVFGALHLQGTVPSALSAILAEILDPVGEPGCRLSGPGPYNVTLLACLTVSPLLQPLRVLAMDAEYAVGLAQEYKAAAGWQVDITVKVRDPDAARISRVRSPAILTLAPAPCLSVQYGNSDLDSYLALRSQGGSNQPLALYDAFIFRPDRFASLAAAGVLMPLAPVLATPEGQAMKVGNSCAHHTHTNARRTPCSSTAFRPCCVQRCKAHASCVCARF